MINRSNSLVYPNNFASLDVEFPKREYQNIIMILLPRIYFLKIN